MTLFKRKTKIATINTLDEILAYITDKNFHRLTKIPKQRLKQMLLVEKYTETEFKNNLRKIFNYSKTSQSHFQQEFWTIRGWTENEAIEKISNIQKNNSLKFTSKVQSGKINHNFSKNYLLESYSIEASNKILSVRSKIGALAYKNKRNLTPDKYKYSFNNTIEFYLHRGYSEKEAKLKLLDRQTTFSLEICVENFGLEKGTEVFNNRQIKWRKSFNKHSIKYIEKKKKNTRIYKGLQIPDSMISDFDLYRRVVRNITNKNAHIVPKIEIRGTKYHLDHKYSIKQGFLDNVPAYIIGSVNNLEMLYYKENCSKQDKCSISLDELCLARHIN